MRDTEVISWMHHLAESADSDVLADDLHSLANSFDEYIENGAIDDEIDELERSIVMDKHDVYDWLVDELEQRGVSDVHSVISHVYLPLDYLDEKPPAICVKKRFVDKYDMPQSPDGWEWKRYTNTREPNYLVKTGDDSSDRRLNPLSAINNNPDIETYNEALIWLKEQFGSRREYGHTTLYDPPGGFRDAVYVEGVDIDDWPASPDGWKWNVAIEMDNKLYLMKKVSEQ